jgi:hypothetical protein
MPDLIIWYFGTWGIELKRRGAKLSGDPHRPHGKARAVDHLIAACGVFPKLIASGWAAIEVCHSREEVLAQVNKWGIPTRGRLA